MSKEVLYVECVDDAGVPWKCFKTRYFAECFIEDYECDYGLVIQKEGDGFRIYELRPWV